MLQLSEGCAKQLILLRTFCHLQQHTRNDGFLEYLFCFLRNAVLRSVLLPKVINA